MHDVNATGLYFEGNENIASEEDIPFCSRNHINLTATDFSSVHIHDVSVTGHNMMAMKTDGVYTTPTYMEEI